MYEFARSRANDEEYKYNRATNNRAREEKNEIFVRGTDGEHISGNGARFRSLSRVNRAIVEDLDSAGGSAYAS